MNIVLGDGPIPCKTMVIGEAPGANEIEQGKPFVGASGKVLNEALEAAGLPRSNVFVTNIYKSRPPNNRDPSELEIEAHRDLLMNELSWVDPEYILLLGNVSLKFFTGQTGISNFRGTKVSSFIKDVYVYATYHPAATMYKVGLREEFFNDIRTFAKIVNGTYMS
jgi:DNA polymerase